MYESDFSNGFRNANGIQTNAPPIAIIMSLSQTLSDSLYWPLAKNDSSARVQARGIFYLLILSQYFSIKIEAD